VSRSDEVIIAPKVQTLASPSLKGNSPVRGNVCEADKRVPVSGGKGGSRRVTGGFCPFSEKKVADVSTSDGEVLRIVLLLAARAFFSRPLSPYGQLPLKGAPRIKRTFLLPDLAG